MIDLLHGIVEMETQSYAPTPGGGHHTFLPEPIEALFIPLDQKYTAVPLPLGDIGFQKPEFGKGLHGPLGESLHLFPDVVLPDIVQELQGKFQASKVQGIQMPGFQKFTKGNTVPF